MPASEQDSPQTPAQALQGLKVVECATVIAAPLCGRLLADFGAEVIHVEHPEKGDDLRHFGFTIDGVNPWWKSYARNKKTVTLNISKPRGREILFRLLEDADIFVENFRPGRLEEWGISYEILAEINPRLIMVRVSGFGQYGPYSSQPGFGTLIEAMSGFAHLTGQPDGPPTLPQFALADSFAGCYATMAAMFAVYHRDVIGTYYLVSGSGSETTRVERTGTSMLSEASKGYMRLDLYDDGALGVDVLALRDGEQAEAIFSHCLATGPPLPQRGRREMRPTSTMLSE